MIHIAVCDDEKAFVTHLTQLLEQYSAETGEEIKVSAWYDGLELLEKYDTTIDLIFLDIQMKYVDGLETAGRIRQMDDTVGIIFLTTLTQYALEGYQYGATNYIIKPLKYARLKSELDKFLSRHRRAKCPAYCIVNDTGKYRIQLNSLRYVETFNRNLLFHTEQDKIICYKSMKELEQELTEQGFARCHSSYLVNLAYVKGARKLEITLITGEVLPISQPRRKAFMEKLAEYWGDML